MSFSPSPQQTAFVDALLNSTANVALVARAGTGKTTTSVYGAAQYAAKFAQRSVLICCFGNAAAKDAQAKLEAAGHGAWTEVAGRRRPPQIQASTTHSLGLKLVAKAFPGVKTEGAKVQNLIRARNGAVFAEHGAAIQAFVEKAKVDGFGFFADNQIGDRGAWYRLADQYNLAFFDDTTDLEAVIDAAQEIYRASLAQTDAIDFADMILFPLVKNLRAPPYLQFDLVIIDEAQDTSRARQALVKKFICQGGRAVVVGDDCQAIMAFAGADNNAMPNLVRDFSAVELPLTVTYRCPKSVVALAQAYVPDYEAHESAPEGEVLRVNELPADLRPGDAILCRNMAPLVTQAYRLIRRGVPARVEGRDIGKGIVALARRWPVTNIDDMLDRLDHFQERERQKIEAKGGDEDKLNALADRCDTLREISKEVLESGKTGVSDVAAFVDSVFKDSNDGEAVKDAVTLCTYHRSKGREWKRVILFEHGTRCPSPFARRPAAIQQERNLAYVAITRAMQTLVFAG